MKLSVPLMALRRTMELVAESTVWLSYRSSSSPSKVRFFFIRAILTGAPGSL